ncbi:OLC1v1033955C1 [Oldenlandia corymbosa var. corymbosa]|uniref:OLC1v1033955C1 n=1 Tax=Oldenlandia corymbosa var. corymbosa TaxID=529605 RepID=A0AAV1CS22_OLDCO|nr:OLC1v1033955C1 [Oldenlandia corymbosa var. corymbosa]
MAMDRKLKDSFKSLFFISSGLACLTCFSILFYINSTSRLLNHPNKIPHPTHLTLKPPLQIYSVINHFPAEVVSSATTHQRISYREEERFRLSSVPANHVVDNNGNDSGGAHLDQVEPNNTTRIHPEPAGETLPSYIRNQNRRPNDVGPQQGSEGKKVKDQALEAYHDRDFFMQEYKEMNRSLRIFIYPPKPNDPFADLMLPEEIEPGGNYASESYFKQNLFKSHFITKNPAEADLFYLPFSMATLRHDRRIGVQGIPDFVKNYIYNISHEYPYWNRTGGADHFYVACHSIGRTAMVKADEVKTNAIQVVCSSSYFLTGYVSHKDASIPQIWPRKGNPPTRPPSQSNIKPAAGGPPNRVESGKTSLRLVSHEEYFRVLSEAPANVGTGHGDRNFSHPVLVNGSGLFSGYYDRVNVNHVQQEEEEDKSSTIDLPEPVGKTSRLSSGNHHNQWLEIDDDGRMLPQGNEKGNQSDVLEVYHDRNLFIQEYKEMNKSLKIFVYPVKPGDPFANLLLPVKYEPGGNYASESYFKKNLFKSHFITKNPSEADLFYLPFSVASLRHDTRIGVKGIPDFVKNYIYNISHEYPYWNRTGGADHFYVACHSIGKTAMKKAIQVEINAIQVVCSSSYFLTGYVPHKDASIPQIWPRKGNPPTRAPSKRKKLAFYAGAMNSRERKFLVQVWENDTEISVHKRRLKTPYSEALLGSKFCLHAKGFEVNTARIGDALYYGCVPVILADYYDLPFSDILNWERFSVVMMSMDIPMLKHILGKEVSSKNYVKFQRNVMQKFPTTMAAASALVMLCNTQFCAKLTKLHSLRAIFFIPTTFALLTTCSVLFYISSSSSTFLFVFPEQSHLRLLQSAHGSALNSSSTLRHHGCSNNPPILDSIPSLTGESNLFSNDFNKGSHFGIDEETFQRNAEELDKKSSGDDVDTEEYHDKDLFMDNYREMNKSFKIYVYPYGRDHPFANVLLPVEFEPGGNYASESYFKKALLSSHFITKDPYEADLFFLPFAIARLRHDSRVGISGIQDFIRDYLFNISHEYPFWNRTGGSDHFYVACHSVGRSAINKAVELKLNAIQVVCSSSYYASAYVAHKDASLPQIWPRHGDNPDFASKKREKLAFFSGSLNSPVREKLLQVWENDTEISVHRGHLQRSYTEELLDSKFCLHVKGFEVNTARIGDAVYFGCVPVIIANHYDLPFSDMLNWKSFSVVVATLDIPQLKKILQDISDDEYVVLRNNLLKVRKHFQWHFPCLDYDAFYMVMLELWLRRNSMRVIGDVN